MPIKAVAGVCPDSFSLCSVLHFIAVFLVGKVKDSCLFNLLSRLEFYSMQISSIVFPVGFFLL